LKGEDDSGRYRNRNHKDHGWQGGQLQSKVRIEGTEAVYISTGGATRIAQPDRPLVQIRAREPWTLSPDGKTLTIWSEVDSSTLALPGFQLEEPSAEFYTRQ